MTAATVPSATAKAVAASAEAATHPAAAPKAAAAATESMPAAETVTTTSEARVHVRSRLHRATLRGWKAP